MLHGEIVWVGGTEEVRNVLVEVNSSTTTNTAQNKINDYMGQYADYTLHFPKTYDGDLTGQIITVRGHDCEVLGSPDHVRQEKVFGSRWHGIWDMTVRARRVVVSNLENARVFARVVERDQVGRRSEVENDVFEGMMQARMSSGDEKNERGGTDSVVRYVFVFEWTDDLREYSTQQLFVEYDGHIYDVISVENKNELNKTAVLVGERHE